MAEVINILKNQANKLGLIIEGLEDMSRLSYPKEYDLGASLLDEVVEDLTRVKNRLSGFQNQKWLYSLIRVLSWKG